MFVVNKTKTIISDNYVLYIRLHTLCKYMYLF